MNANSQSTSSLTDDVIKTPEENAKSAIENNKTTNELSVAQKVRMERNRQRALLLRSSRLTAHPYAPPPGAEGMTGKKIHVGGARMVDSGGGFFIDEEEQDEQVLTAADLPQQPGIHFALIQYSQYIVKMVNIVKGIEKSAQVPFIRLFG